MGTILAPGRGPFKVDWPDGYLQSVESDAHVMAVKLEQDGQAVGRIRVVIGNEHSHRTTFPCGIGSKGDAFAPTAPGAGPLQFAPSKCLSILMSDSSLTNRFAHLIEPPAVLKAVNDRGNLGALDGRVFRKLGPEWDPKAQGARGRRADPLEF